MHSWHAKSPCCRAKIYHFGSRRRQCSHCKRTWRIRNKRRGRKPRRTHPRSLKTVFLDGHTLKALAPHYGLTHQGLSWRFRRECANSERDPGVCTCQEDRWFCSWTDSISASEAKTG